MQNRCVITGLGVISAIGRGVEENRRNILASKSGIDHTHTLDTENCYADFAAEVKDFTETDPSLDRATALCLTATSEAVADAGLSDFGGNPARQRDHGQLRGRRQKSGILLSRRANSLPMC